MEKFIQEQKPKQLQFQPKELISYMIEMRKVLKAANVSDDVIAKGFAEFSENQGGERTPAYRGGSFLFQREQHL